MLRDRFQVHHRCSFQLPLLCYHFLHVLLYVSLYLFLSIKKAVDLSHFGKIQCVRGDDGILLCTVKIPLSPRGSNEMEEHTSSAERYATCRYRDLCLRYLGQNPEKFIQIAITPCPCSHSFFRELMRYKSMEDGLFSQEPFVQMYEEHEVRRKTHRDEIPITQQRLFE